MQARPSWTLAGRAWMLARFVMVGVLCALAYSALTTVFIGHVGLPVFLAGGFAYILVTPASYLLHRSFTFRVQSAHRESWPRYLAVSLFATLLSAVMPAVLSSEQGFNLSINFSLALTCVAVPFFSFLAKSIWVFTHRGSKTG